jgi:hypothetical protein
MMMIQSKPSVVVEIYWQDQSETEIINLNIFVENPRVEKFMAWLQSKELQFETNSYHGRSGYGLFQVQEDPSVMDRLLIAFNQMGYPTKSDWKHYE